MVIRPYNFGYELPKATRKEQRRSNHFLNFFMILFVGPLRSISYLSHLVLNFSTGIENSSSDLGEEQERISLFLKRLVREQSQKSFSCHHYHTHPCIITANMLKSEIVIKIYNGDVRPGSRYEANIHPGNRFYKRCIEASREKYRRAYYHQDARTCWKLREKYALQVYNQVMVERNGKSGRFLKFKRNMYHGVTVDTNHFKVMTKSEALQKIHRSFRNSSQGTGKHRNGAVGIRYY